MADKLKIYVVDDDSMMVDIMAAILEEAGHKVYADISAAFAISRIVSVKPDVLITDLMMSEMNGIQLCEQLRGRPELNSMKILMFTSKDDDYWRQNAMKAGADGFLGKPVEADVLLQAINDVLASEGRSAETDGAEAAPSSALPGRR